MHIDFKITTWERVEVEEEFQEAVREAVKSGKINSADELFDFITELGGDPRCDKLDDVDEQMTPEENGGASTVEMFEEVGSGFPMARTFGNGNEEIDNF